MAEAKKSTKKTKEPKETIEKPEETSAEQEQAAEQEVPKAVAKAGRRSAKAVKEAEQKQVKQERKSQAKTAEEQPKQASKPPRSRVERAGKKYKEAAKLVEKNKLYSLPEALDLATKTSPAKFDATVELHVNLGVDPKQSDQNVRGNIVLPSGTGKTARVAVFAEADDIEKAKKAGAELVGADAIAAELDKQQVNFDILISTPALMPRLSKYARFLGPRGLMPNPKSGTVAADVAKAVKEAKAGRIEYRVDSAGIIHLGIGKVSFGPQKLLQNAEALLTSIRASRPASLKGIYIKSAYVSTTMGPSIKLEIR